VGPFDQARIERRADVLCYTTAPLAEPLELAGGVDVTLYASSSAPDTDWVPKLCDVGPDGTSLNLCDGIVRAKWRNGLAEPSYLEPGRVYDYAIDLGPIAHVFAAGHRVRLQLASSNFPGWDRNMNTTNPPGVDATGQVAHQAVLHDAAHPSHVTVWVMP
jgi:putative CocE/NonD family hydrolase